MLKDVLIPSKLGNTYIFSKKVLYIDISQFAVQGMLVEYQRRNVYIQNKQSILLKDFSQQALVAAIKKMVSNFKSYDEIVTSLSSTSIVYKELELPFIGKEKIEMILSYEIESLLPFSLDKAVIDFIVTYEDMQKKSSKILVAAALKEDIDKQLVLFEKAEVSITTMAVDMFALYELYKQGLYKTPVQDISKKDKNSLVLQQRIIEVVIDIGFSVTRIIYLDNNVLKGVRVIPYGVSDLAQAVSKHLELSYYDVVQQLIAQENIENYQETISKELPKLFNHINQTLSFFEKQMHADYKIPQKIMFSGLGCSLYNFMEMAQNYITIKVEELSIDTILKSLQITVSKKIEIKLQDITFLAIMLLDKYNNDVNLLEGITHRIENSLLYKQLAAIIILSITCIAAIYLHSSSELQRWNQAYLSSKKELIAKIDQSMGLDLKTEKNLKRIVERTQEAYKAAHKRWFAFAKQKERSYLEYLQDLSVRIDKDSIGLDVSKLMIEPEKVTMVGKLKDFEALEVFEEELSELDLLQVVEKPRELSFTIQLKVKNKGQQDVD